MPNLGLVCITASDRIRYRTITGKRLLQFSAEEQQQLLFELYVENLRRLNQAHDFCLEQDIRLYRLSSALFPFSDQPAGAEVLAGLAARLGQTGERFQASGIRLVVHPDQFVVLNSDSAHVIENSVTFLEAQAHMLDLLAQPRSPWATIELHGGKGDRAARLVEVIGRLPDGIRSRLALENDERAYSAGEILAVCRAAAVPMIFDAHHHVVHERLDNYKHASIQAMVTAARDTWPDPAWQIVHISNGRTAFADPRHSDLITEMPTAFRHVPWIEVEAKGKEVAIERLRRGEVGSDE